VGRVRGPSEEIPVTKITNLRDIFESGSYPGIKMLEHVLMIYERIVEVRVREKIKIDNMQLGFMGGIGTKDAIFIVRQMQQKYIAKKKNF